MIASPITLALAVTAAALFVANPGMAAAGDEVVVSATPAAKLPTAEEVAKAKADAQARADAAPKPASTQDQVIAWQANTAPIQHGSDIAATDHLTQPVRDNGGLRTIHGSAGASIGTGGYRSAYVTALIPVGENGTLGIAVSQTDYGKNNVYGYGRGYGYGSPYGYNYGGYGYGDRYGYGRRGGTSTSVGLSFNTSDDAGSADAPPGCAPGFRDGGRYIEPVWVTQMHDNRNCMADDQP